MRQVSNVDQLTTIRTALERVDPCVGTLTTPLAPGAAFVGSGDSLSSAFLAAPFGHRPLSSGDITWVGRVPAAVSTVVGISHSGTSGATVRALRIARESGIRTVAITSQPDAPLAHEADEVQLVPQLGTHEVIPVAGHLMLSLGVAAVCGLDVTAVPSAVGSALHRMEVTVLRTLAAFPTDAPAALSVLTLPDVRGTGDFAALKIIEATGVTVRTVALEESGHVDYFIGPQPHLSLVLTGGVGHARADRLGAALEHAGHTVVTVQIGDPSVGDVCTELVRELAGAVLMSALAGVAAERWRRPRSAAAR